MRLASRLRTSCMRLASRLRAVGVRLASVLRPSCVCFVSRLHADAELAPRSAIRFHSEGYPSRSVLTYVALSLTLPFLLN